MGSHPMHESQFWTKIHTQISQRFLHFLTVQYLSYVKKTEQIRLNQPIDSQQNPITVEGAEIAIIEDFKYLGSRVANTEADVKMRIGLAWTAFNKLKHILTSKLVVIDTKLRLFDAVFQSIVLYGAESWLLNDALASKLDVYARNRYRIILGSNQSEDHVTNEELYKRTNRRPVKATIPERQLRFVGHCLWMAVDEPSNIYALYTRKEIQRKSQQEGEVGQNAFTTTKLPTKFAISRE